MKRKIIFLMLMIIESSLCAMESGAGGETPLGDNDDLWSLLTADNFRAFHEMGELAGNVAENVARARQGHLENLARDRESIERRIEILQQNREQYQLEEYKVEMETLKMQLGAAYKREDAENKFSQTVGEVVAGATNQAVGALFGHLRNKDELNKAVAVASVEADAKRAGDNERLNMVLKRDNLIKIGAFVVLVAAGVFGSYYALTYLYRYFEAKMGMPTLIRDSSRFGWKDVLLQYLGKKNRRDENAFRDVVLAPPVAEKVFSLAAATTLTHEKGLQYRHLLLYGPPGTGKTLVAKTLAHSSGMDYAIISGADFSQFKQGLDIQKLHEIFDWADKGARGLILFIDEADALLRDRKQLDERGVKLVNAFLSRTNASSDKFMVVLATNYPENLDAAVLSRINKKVSIPLPTRDERIRLLKLYTSKYLLQGSDEGLEKKDKQEKKKKTKKKEIVLIVAPEINDAYLISLADRIDGFSGRDIDQLLSDIRIEGAMTEDNMVTKDLFDRIVASKIDQYKQERVWEVAGGKNAVFPVHGKADALSVAK